MSLKYRIRLKNDRIIGPVSIDEIEELFEKKHISGEEVFQQFPIGDWRPINKFIEIKNIKDKVSKNNQTLTNIKNVSSNANPSDTKEKTN